MGLNVAVFVPEGVILASDTTAFIRSEDEGYFSSSERTFICFDKFVVSFIGNGYINNLPYGYYVNSFMAKCVDNNYNTKEFTQGLNEFFNVIETDDLISLYVAGIDIQKASVIPYLFLIDRNEIMCLNHSPDNKELLYNYHSVGQSLWINKLLLPTQFEDDKIGVSETYDSVNIDFKKFSIERAKDFAIFLLNTSAQIESFCQMRPVINNQMNVAFIEAFKTPILKKIII